MTYRELAGALGVSEVLLKNRKYKALDFPKADRSHRYCVEDVCRWILRNSRKGNKLSRGAESVLAEIGKSAAKVSRPHAKRPPSTELKRLDDAEFSTSLSQFRQAVLDCRERYQNAIASGDELAIQIALKTWGVSMETLRKAEESVLNIERERGQLVPLAAAKEFQVAVWTAVKQKLLTLGARLAPTLVNISSQKMIQDALDTEARQILDDAKRRLE